VVLFLGGSFSIVNVLGGGGFFIDQERELLVRGAAHGGYKVISQ